MERDLGALPHSRLIVLRDNDCAYSAARAMHENNVGCVVVSDQRGHLVGILTDRDLVVRLVCNGEPAEETPLREVMTPFPAAVYPDQNTEDALWLMGSVGARRVPVVDLDGHPIGLVTLDDVLLSLGPGLEGVQSVLRRQAELPGRAASDPGALTPSPHSLSPEDYLLILEEARQAPRQARAAQTMGKLLSMVRECLARQNVFVVDRKRLADGLGVYLSMLVRAVRVDQAHSLIAQLPSKLREGLLSEKAGPDASVTLDRLKEQLAQSMELSAWQQEGALLAFAEALSLSVSEGEFDRLRRALPEQLRAAFPEQELRVAS